MKIRIQRAKALSILVAAAAAISSVSAVPFYSMPCKSQYPTQGELWNTEPDGSGQRGNSTTIVTGEHDLVIQFNTNMYLTPKNEDLRWSAGRYYLHGGELMNRGYYAEFNGGEMEVTDEGFTFKHASPIGGCLGGIRGSSKVLLNGNTLSLTSHSSGSAGIFDFGLSVVGKGTIDLQYSNAATVWHFSALTSEFTGWIRGDRFHGTIRFSPEADLSAARIDVGRQKGDRSGKLDLTHDIRLGSLFIGGDRIATGVYTYDQLVAMNPAYAKNLMRSGGTVTVVK